MIVVHRAHGFRFVIYTSDDEPAHIHITGPGYAKINLTGADGKPELVLTRISRMNDIELVRIHRIWHEHQRVADDMVAR